MIKSRLYFDYSNLDTYTPGNLEKDVVDLEYDFLKVKLEFEGNLNITLNMQQFKSLYGKMVELHDQIYEEKVKELV